VPGQMTLFVLNLLFRFYFRGNALKFTKHFYISFHPPWEGTKKFSDKDALCFKQASLCTGFAFTCSAFISSFEVTE
jgi:hypothetical protein